MKTFGNSRIDRFALKVAILFGLSALFGIWLGLSIAGSVLVGLGYRFFTSWVSTFEAFRHGNELNKGVTYVIAMVAEFDEYTNDWLYLREGTIFPKAVLITLCAARPHYRKRAVSQPSELSVRGRQAAGGKISYAQMEAPAMHIPRLANTRSVRESIHQVKIVQDEWDDERCQNFPLMGEISPSCEELDRISTTIEDVLHQIKLLFYTCLMYYRMSFLRFTKLELSRHSKAKLDFQLINRISMYLYMYQEC
ncbi:hypothetical protein ACLB2K_003659 [Fragaria x ananassa]